MQFDLFYELAVPGYTGVEDAAEQAVFHDTLAELALADELGFGAAWLVEHHFMPEYSHSSAPDLFLAAAAQRTTRLRLGLGIVPLPYHHPVLVAERIATLDILSRGRVELGIGRGFSPLEHRVFAAPMADSRAQMGEALDLLRACLGPDPISHAGTFYAVPEAVTVHPRPVQRPHPPLWLAAVSPESFELAAGLGLGVLAGPFKPWFMVREDLRRYRRAWQAAGHAAPPRAAMTLGILCLEDGRRARQLGRQCMPWFYRLLLQHTRPVLAELYAGYEYYRRLGRLAPLMEKTLSLKTLELLGLVIVGDPAHCRRKLAALTGAGVDRVLCAVGAGGLPHGIVCESLELLAREVLPHFEGGA